MPINDNDILGVLPSGFLGYGDSTINDGWGFFPPGDVFQIRTSQAVERLTGSVRGSWRPLSFLEASLVLGMDRVRQSDRQLQARGEGPNIGGLRLGRVGGGRAPARPPTPPARRPPPPPPAAPPPPPPRPAP